MKMELRRNREVVGDVQYDRSRGLLKVKVKGFPVFHYRRVHQVLSMLASLRVRLKHEDIQTLYSDERSREASLPGKPPNRRVAKELAYLRERASRLGYDVVPQTQPQ